MGLRLLVVDDDADILEWIRLEFQKLGSEFSVETAKSGNGALNLFMEKRFDFVLSDISMEGMDGHVLYQKIKELDDSMPIAMMTAFGYDPKHIVVNAVKLGLTDVLFKPFEIEDLIDLINKRV